MGKIFGGNTGRFKVREEWRVKDIRLGGLDRNSLDHLEMADRYWRSRFWFLGRIFRFSFSF